MIGLCNIRGGGGIQKRVPCTAVSFGEGLEKVL